MKKIFSFFSSAFFSVALLIMATQGHAGMVTTPSLLVQDLTTDELVQSRQQITKQLVELGVEEQIASARVASMSDQQIIEINQKIDELPAGADAGGLLVAVFVVLVITDAMGVTDVFSFVSPSR
ncbi:MAG: PA2779 family protein [Gammaproteobacteria bacterium]|nr:PA2779 family protein [Gammaproteobacteria bacterium]